MRSARIGVILAASLAVGALSSACKGPCESLSDKICSCRPSRGEENQCLEQVRAASSGRDVTEQEAMACDAALETCTCGALELEDFAACGLAQANTSSVAQ